MGCGILRGDMDLSKAKQTAVSVARQAGEIMRQHLAAPKRVDSATKYDIKLELDRRCQKVIERQLRAAYPEVEFLGEEDAGRITDAEYRWVVDPIDGTVNFAYGIPHACVSIALQSRAERLQERRKPTRRGGERINAQSWSSALRAYPDGYVTLCGVVYDPFCDELWTATVGQLARLNGRIIRVSRRSRLAEAIISIGLSKSREHLEATLPMLNQLARRVRKMRIMGAGALDLVYVATGRFDAYLERRIRLWDIAAGGLILECAGGEIWRQTVAGEYAFQMIASNGLLGRQIRSGAT